MRWARVALYTLAGVVGLLALCLIVVLNVDLGRSREFTQNLLTGILDREFAIEGEFSVNVDLTRIHVVAADVRLAGADWSSDPDMISVGRLDGSVNTWSLISWPIRIESLDAERIRIKLEHNAEGAANWQFFEPREEDEEEEASKAPPRLPLVANTASIRDLALIYDNPGRPRPFELIASELGLSKDEEDYLTVDLDGTINDTPLTLDVRAGTVENLVDFYGVSFAVSGILGEIKLDGEAEFGNLINPRRPTARLNIAGPNAEYLTTILRLEQITTGPLNLTADIAPAGDRMEFGLNGDFGEFALELSGRFDDLQAMNDIDVRAVASGPDAATIGKLIGNPKVPQDPFSVLGVFSRSGTTIAIDEITVAIGRTRFHLTAHFDDFPRPTGANAAIRIEGPDFGRFNRLFGLPGRLHGPFKLDADVVPVADGGATIRLSADADDLKFTVEGTVADTADFSGTRLRADFAGPNLRTVTTAAGIADAPAEPFSFGLGVERVPDGLMVEDGVLTINDDRFGFDGMIGNKPLEADTDISFEATGPDLVSLLTEFGLDADELPDTQYRASGRVERATDHFELHEIKLSIGDDLEYDFRVDGIVTDRPNLEGSRVQLRAQGASLGALTDAVGVPDLPDLPFRVGATAERVAKGFSIENGSAQLGEDRVAIHGLVGEKPLQRDTSLEFDANMHDLASTLGAFGVEITALPAGEFAAGGQIRARGEQFSLNNVVASLAGTQATLNGRLGGFPTLDGTNLKIRARGEDLAGMLPPNDRLAGLARPFSVSADVTVDDQALAVSDLTFRIDEFELQADFGTVLSSILQQGELTLQASSSDVLPLLPKFAEISVPQTAPLRLRSDIAWQDNVLTVKEFDMLLGEGTLVASGAIGGAPDFNETDLRFDWNISSINKLSPLAGRELPDESAHLVFHLTGSRGVVQLQQFEGRIGDSDIVGHFAYRSGDIPEVDIGFTSELLDIEPYQPEESPAPAEEAPADAPKKTRLIPDTPIPMDRLNSVVADVDIKIGRVNLRHRQLADIVLKGSLRDGALVVEEFNLGNDRGAELSGGFELRPSGEKAALVFDMTGSSLTLGLPAESEEAFATLPRYELDTLIVGTGATVRELAGSLNGYVRLVSGAGRVKATALRFFTQDFLMQVLNTVNPFTVSDPYTNLQCSAILMRMSDGVITGRPALVSMSEKLKILANAKIDLKTEKLDVDIRTVPQTGLGLSFSDLVNPYTKVGGTLAKPTLTLDPEGALIEGGAAVATAGLSILAVRFKERFLDSKDPCGDAVRATEATFTELKDKYRPDAPEAGR